MATVAQTMRWATSMKAGAIRSRSAADTGTLQRRASAATLGADRVILGSDWPHMEGLEHPRDILEELDGVAAADREKILFDNAKALNERRPL